MQNRARAVITLPVHEHLYQLHPGEDPALIDGHLLVVLLDGGSLSNAFYDYCVRRVIGLSDKAEFQMALVPADDFPEFRDRASDMPALFHFACGVEKSREFGVDDCLEFFREFIANNRRQ